MKVLQEHKSIAKLKSTFFGYKWLKIKEKSDKLISAVSIFTSYFNFRLVCYSHELAGKHFVQTWTKRTLAYSYKRRILLYSSRRAVRILD